MTANAQASPVCIVGGTGALGFGLAVRLVRAGVPIVIGSRDAGRAHEAARAAVGLGTESCVGKSNTDAVPDAGIVILSVPFRSQSETLTNLRPALRPGQVLVDATVPLATATGGKATRTLSVWQGSAAQQAQEIVPDGVRVGPRFTPSVPRCSVTPTTSSTRTSGSAAIVARTRRLSPT